MTLGDPRRPCYARHMGLWSVEPLWFTRTVAAVKAGIYQPQTEAGTYDTPRPYRNESGVAVIEISGPLMKGGGSFGEVDSVATRKAIRDAVRDEDVGALMLLIDSPGGTVAGTEELANEIRNAAAVKPVFSHFEDLGASAAYWVGTQAGRERVSASPTAEVGSIGTVAVVEDTSGSAEAEGIKVHVISTGPYKGAFVEGSPVTPDHLAYLQERVNDLNGHFIEAVRSARKVSRTKVEEWADGRVWIAEKAQTLGLVDKVQRFDQAMEAAKKAVPRRSSSRTKLAIAEAENIDTGPLTVQGD